MIFSKTPVEHKIKLSFIRYYILFTAMCLLVIIAPNYAFACGAKTDCKLSNGTYRILLPDNKSTTKTVEAIVYLHGWQNTAEGAMRFKALTNATQKLGVALIAPQGINKSWSLPNVFHKTRDDIAFVENVIDHAAAKFSINKSKILISGFSLGGSMTWYIACAKGHQYAGYAPIAGAFWHPYPSACKTKNSNIFHVHGLKDKMVPIKGREIRPGLRQGDVLQSFQILEKSNSCKNTFLTPKANNIGLNCQKALCDSAIKELCVHNAGHSIQPKWIVRAWKLLTDKNGWKS